MPSVECMYSADECGSLLQVNIVGKAQTSYLPGVLVPEVNAGGVAEQAGFQKGDVILRVGDHEVQANPSQVSRA